MWWVRNLSRIQGKLRVETSASFGQALRVGLFPSLFETQFFSLQILSLKIHITRAYKKSEKDRKKYVLVQ